MNRTEYMRELERLLQNIPENERKEAMSYYEEYFDDAGAENEQQAIEELGYPNKAAENIREALKGTPGYQNTGTGYQNTGYQHIGTQNVYTGTTPKTTAGSGDMPTWAIVLIVIGCIIASPVILSIAGSLIGAVFGVIVGIIGCIIGFGAAGLGLLIAGVVCAVIGVPAMFVDGFAGMVLCGVGLLLAALGILFLMATIWLCGWALPTFIKWIIKLCKMPFKKKQQVQC